jgi:hypothetical protein
MIQLDKGPLGTLFLGVSQKEIKSWEVWFRTMSGLHKTLPDALKAAENEEMPQELIRPVTVAVAGDLYEEVHK